MSRLKGKRDALLAAREARQTANGGGGGGGGGGEDFIPLDGKVRVGVEWGIERGRPPKFRNPVMCFASRCLRALCRFFGGNVGGVVCTRVGWRVAALRVSSSGVICTIVVVGFRGFCRWCRKWDPRGYGKSAVRWEVTAVACPRHWDGFSVVEWDGATIVVPSRLCVSLSDDCCHVGFSKPVPTDRKRERSAANMGL